MSERSVTLIRLSRVREIVEQAVNDHQIGITPEFIMTNVEAHVFVEPDWVPLLAVHSCLARMRQNAGRARRAFVWMENQTRLDSKIHNL